MKKYLFLLLLATVTNLAFSQFNYDKTNLLKNDVVLNANSFISKVSSIKKNTTPAYFNKSFIKKETNNLIVKNKTNQINDSVSTRGYIGLFNLGYSIGIGDFGTDRYRISVVNGYRLFKFLSLGLGTGFHYYKDSKAAIVPLFLDISINITSKNVSPYFSFATGYSFDAANNFEKVGLYLSPNIGVNVKLQKRLSFNIGVGYEYQMMNYRTKHYVYYIPYYTPTWYSSSIENNGAISIFAGISF